MAFMFDRFYRSLIAVTCVKLERDIYKTKGSFYNIETSWNYERRK